MLAPEGPEICRWRRMGAWPAQTRAPGRGFIEGLCKEGGSPRRVSPSVTACRARYRGSRMRERDMKRPRLFVFARRWGSGLVGWRGAGLENQDKIVASARQTRRHGVVCCVWFVRARARSCARVLSRARVCAVGRPPLRLARGASSFLSRAAGSSRGAASRGTARSAARTGCGASRSGAAAPGGRGGTAACRRARRSARRRAG